MKEIISILMERDEMTYEEARAAYLECRQEILESPEEAEYILADLLGLELDYIFNFI